MKSNRQNVHPINLMIATPAYNCQMHMDYHNSMLALQEGALKSGINVDFVTIGNQSLVPKARNDIASYFYVSKQYTHLVFIDADVGSPSNCIPALLKRDVDIIGVPVPLKGVDEKGSPVLNIGEVLHIKDGLAETTHVGNAILMFSRQAIDSLVNISDVYYNDPEYSRGSFLTRKAYDIFKIGVVNERYLPEDYYVCHRLREQLGYKIYIDLTIPVKHNGMHSFSTTPDILSNIVVKGSEDTSNVSYVNNLMVFSRRSK